MSTTTTARTAGKLTLTARGELVRDTALAIAAVPFLYGSLIASITLLEGMGL